MISTFYFLECSLSPGIWTLLHKGKISLTKRRSRCKVIFVKGPGEKDDAKYYLDRTGARDAGVDLGLLTFSTATLV